MGIQTGGENCVSNLTKHCGLRPNQALSLCAETLDNLTRGWNVVDQRTALTGNDTSDVEIASLPCCCVLAPNLVHPSFQLALATQPSLGVAVAQQTASIRSRPAYATREVKNDCRPVQP